MKESFRIQQTTKHEVIEIGKVSGMILCEKGFNSHRETNKNIRTWTCLTIGE